MKYILIIYLWIIPYAINSPPPNIEPDYKISTSDNNVNTSKKRLSEYGQFVENSMATITFLENGQKNEQHQLSLTINEGYSESYNFYMSLVDGQSLEVISNSCYKIKSDGEISTEENSCSAFFKKEGKKHSFSYRYDLNPGEHIIINYEITITKKNKEILYRQESVSIPNIFRGGYCIYVFKISKGYINLGLSYNALQKDSDKIYLYDGPCPSEQINEVIKITPSETYWVAEKSYYVQSSKKFSKSIKMRIPRYYRGGTIINKNYRITTTGNKILKESEIIKGQIYLETDLPGDDETKVGINIHTAFTNYKKNVFYVYFTEKLYKINEINQSAKQLAEKALRDTESQYRNYPNYYRIGKFVNSYMKYDINYYGKNLSIEEIIREKRGVCDHYTELYNAMLNSIGIVAIKVYGWAFQGAETSADENTSGHAWTLALINQKWKEIDVTWGLLEGISSGHVLEGFIKEEYTYSTKNSNSDIKLMHTGTIKLVNNLDGEIQEDVQIIPTNPNLSIFINPLLFSQILLLILLL